MSMAQKLCERRRLLILRLLDKGGGRASERVLMIGLEQMGERAGLTEDAVRSDIEFLRAHALVTVEYIDTRGTEFGTTDIIDATITQRGKHVARGRIDVEGVRRAIDED